MPEATPKAGTKDEQKVFQTKELMLSTSFGIFDHIYKFNKKNPMSFALYMFFLAYAKKSGKGRGIYSFSALEMIERMSNPRDENGKPDLLDRTTLTRLIKHLEEIKMIEVLHKPTGQFDPLWTIKICKYKNLDGFLCMRTEDKTAQKVPLQGSNGTRVTVSRATDKQLALFDAHHADEKGYEAEAPLQRSNGRDIKSSEISIGVYKLLPRSIKTIRNKDICDVLEDLRLSKKSSEEIITPAEACKYVENLMREIKGGNAACVVVRNEFVKAYWNGLRRKGYKSKKSLFKRCMNIGDQRAEKLAARFKNKVFREHWADAMVAIKYSPFCRGEIEWTNWRATFDWFIVNDTNVSKVMEGAYRDRSEQNHEPRKIIRQVSGKTYLRGAPLKAIQDYDLEDWIEANPEAAEKAKGSGVLGLRLRNRAESDKAK